MGAMDCLFRDMRDAVCVVTGANSGIGMATAEALSRQDARVLMVCRDRKRGESAAEAIAVQTGRTPELHIADFARLEDVRTVAASIAASVGRVDVLVNNAGLITPTRTITEDGNELTFQVNHLSHFLLTNLLLDKMRLSRDGRVVTVSSDAHFRAFTGINFDDLTFSKDYDGFTAYAHSKLANIMFCYELARRGEAAGITSNAVHPGLVGTNFGMNEGGVVRLFYRLARPFILSAEKGARTVVYCSAAAELGGISGGYFYKMRPKPSSPVSQDEGQWNRLWEESVRLTDMTA